jgi:hypothetical protein
VVKVEHALVTIGGERSTCSVCRTKVFRMAMGQRKHEEQTGMVGGWDCFLCFAWQGSDGARLLVTVNYAPNQSQCHVRLPFADLGNSQWRL